jgi:transcriptional activator SPT7
MSPRKPLRGPNKGLTFTKEIILHSLFESGVSRIQNLERYITDDIGRHGNRLNELEKKITNVYQEFTSAEAIDDDALFANEDDEEEESAFVMYSLLLLCL